MLLCKIYFFSLIFVFSQSLCKGNIADELTRRYYDDKLKCKKGGKTKPAYQCSGIMIRGVRDINSNSQRQFAWHLKSSNRQRESFSAAFLRKDSRFVSFPSHYDSGFIIYPHLKTPQGKNTYKVYCAFPVDGHSDGRAGHGCGQSRDDGSGTSKHCDKLGIKSIKKWVAHYNKIKRAGTYFVRRQCSFDMTKKSAADDFATVIKANTYIRRSNSQYSYRNNELVVHSWNEGRPENIPIEAFFYLIDSPNAYKKAARHQDDYFKQTSGEIVPIVGIRLPTKSNPNILIKNEDRIPNDGGNRQPGPIDHRRKNPKPTNTTPTHSRTERRHFDSTHADPRPADTRPADPRPDPRQTDPRYADSRQTDPRQTDPRKADPRQTDPRKADPRQSEPRQTDPRQFDPRQTDPRQFDPRQTDPRQTHPRQSDPRQTDPRQTDPRHVDPRYADPRYVDSRYADSIPADSRYNPDSRYNADSRYNPDSRYDPDSRYNPDSRRVDPRYADLRYAKRREGA